MAQASTPTWGYRVSFSNSTLLCVLDHPLTQPWPNPHKRGPEHCGRGGWSIVLFWACCVSNSRHEVHKMAPATWEMLWEWNCPSWSPFVYPYLVLFGLQTLSSEAPVLQRNVKPEPYSMNVLGGSPAPSLSATLASSSAETSSCSSIWNPDIVKLLSSVPLIPSHGRNPLTRGILWTFLFLNLTLFGCAGS